MRQEGRGVFAAVFVDQHVVVRKCGFTTGLHWRTGTMDSRGENQDQCGQAGGRPAARHTDRHVRTGGVDQPGAKPAPPRQATHTAIYDRTPCGRASISSGVGHVH